MIVIGCKLRVGQSMLSICCLVWMFLFIVREHVFPLVLNSNKMVLEFALSQQIGFKAQG